MDPEKSEVGLPSVASMMKLFWHDRLIGVEPPVKYCFAVSMLPANGVNTAEFLISGPYGVSDASIACMLVRCPATLGAVTGSLITPCPLTPA